MTLKLIDWQIFLAWRLKPKLNKRNPPTRITKSLDLSRKMKKLAKLFALLASVTILIACGKTETTTPTASPERSPETVTAVKLIPVAVFKEIDIDKKGEITQVQFVEYFVVKKKELMKEDAEKNFKELDKDGTGTLTKEEATGEK